MFIVEYSNGIYTLIVNGEKLEETTSKRSILHSMRIMKDCGYIFGGYFPLW